MPNTIKMEMFLFNSPMYRFHVCTQSQMQFQLFIRTIKTCVLNGFNSSGFVGFPNKHQTPVIHTIPIYKHITSHRIYVCTY